MQRDEEVAPMCLLRPLVIRNSRDSLERALEAKERGKGKKGERGERMESDHGGQDSHLIITEQCPCSVRTPGERDNFNILKSTFTSKFHRRLVTFNVSSKCLSCSCE